MRDASLLEQRVARRLLWVLMPGVLVAFLDRTNVSFAAPTMNPTLGIDAATFGLGAGIFFLGYLLFEVPSNMILPRVGARRWIARIMISWGLVAAAVALATGPNSFLVLRFLLGVAEAGFLPGAMLYASYWIAPSRLGGFTALLLLMVPVASSITALLSAAILTLDGWLGVAGWQWIFILQGLPAVALGLVALAFLDDRPADAAWLSDDEKRQIGRTTGGGGTGGHPPVGAMLATAARNRRIWGLGGGYFLINLALGSQPWFPLMLAQHGWSAGHVALALAAPNALAAIAMVGWARRSDRAGERANHLLLAALLSGGGWLLCAIAGSDIMVVAGIGLALIGMFACVAVFWAVPAAMLSAHDRPVGIAAITCIGLIGSFVSPVVTGRLKVATGSYDFGMYLAAAGIVLGALLVRTSVSRLRE